MPTLKLSAAFDKLSSDGTIAYIKDLTGTYSLTNLGGYGIETQLKSSLHFIVKVTTIFTEGIIVSSVYGKVSATLPNTLEFPIPQDSAVKIEVRAVPIYNVANLGTYTDGQLLWDATANTLAVAVVPTILSANLKPVTESETTPDMYLAKVVFYDVIQSVTRKALVNLRIRTANACEEDLPMFVRQLIRLDNYLKAACDAIGAGLRKEAARLMFEAVRMIHADKVTNSPDNC